MSDEQLRPPEVALFWQWVWSAIRPVLGWLLAGLGALALGLGWYGVSGTAVTAKQLPYLISGGLTGMALIIMAGVFLATEDVRRQLGRLGEVERKVDQLFRLLVEEADAGDRGGPGSRLAVPGGSSYHRPECALVAGKDSATAVTPRTAGERGLRPCRVCDPAPFEAT